MCVAYFFLCVYCRHQGTTLSGNFEDRCDINMNAETVLTCPYMVYATFSCFFTAGALFCSAHVPPAPLFPSPLTASHVRLLFTRRLLSCRNLQETGSYAEFSRLLQHTADGNVFKKVESCRQKRPASSFFFSRF